MKFFCVPIITKYGTNSTQHIHTKKGLGQPLYKYTKMIHTKKVHMILLGSKCLEQLANREHKLV